MSDAYDLDFLDYDAIAKECDKTNHQQLCNKLYGPGPNTLKIITQPSVSVKEVDIAFAPHPDPMGAISVRGAMPKEDLIEDCKTLYNVPNTNESTFDVEFKHEFWEAPAGITRNITTPTMDINLSAEVD